VATPIAGRRGRLYVGLASGGTAEPVANLKSFSMDFSTDRYDVTCFGDTNKVETAGLPNATGDFSGFYDTASAQLYTASQDGVARKFYAYVDTSTLDYWFGTAYFDFHIELAVDSTVDISGSFAAATGVFKVEAA
jgi:hypothetical protein